MASTSIMPYHNLLLKPLTASASPTRPNPFSLHNPVALPHYLAIRRQARRAMRSEQHYQQSIVLADLGRFARLKGYTSFSDELFAKAHEKAARADSRIVPDALVEIGIREGDVLPRRGIETLEQVRRTSPDDYVGVRAAHALQYFSSAHLD